MTDAVLAELRRAILSGSLAAGTRLTQEQLAARLAVSRAPVRQALSILEREGLVQAERSRGAMVTPREPSMIRDMYQFRGEIERFVASHLAERKDFDPRPLRAVVDAGRAAAPAGDVAQLIEIDLRFHTGLYDAVGNQVLSEVMRGQWTHIRRVMGATLAITGYRSQVWDEHTTVLDAIAAHQPDVAGTLASRHTSAACAVLLKTLKGQAIARSESPDAAEPVQRPSGVRRRRRRASAG